MDPRVANRFFSPLLAMVMATCTLAAAPKVKKATPDNGETGVDPSLREITIVFDQAMSKDGMSVVGGGETYPELRGKPRWKGSRTFVIPVSLQPNHSYWLSINSEKFQNFRNTSGEPAVPYPISFQTGPGKSGAAGEANVDNATAFAELKEAILTQYSHRDKLGIDWERVFVQNREALESTATAKAFARTAATLLAKAQDKHLWLVHNGQMIPTYVSPSQPNGDGRILSRVVPKVKKVSPTVLTGRWDDGIVYLAIGSWDAKQPKALDPVFETIKSANGAPGLIIDVRFNGGGAEPLARNVAGCFVEEPVVYAKHVIVDPDSPDGFSAPHERVLQPNRALPTHRGRVAVLTGPAVMSSNEAFLLMMRSAGATLVGMNSQGSSGNPQPVELSNGVTVYVPCWKPQTADGQYFEGVGIAPDIKVNSTPADFRTGDPVIEAAVKHLRTKAGSVAPKD